MVTMVTMVTMVILRSSPIPSISWESLGGYSSNSHFIQYFLMVSPQLVTAVFTGFINPGLTLLMKPWIDDRPASKKWRHSNEVFEIAPVDWFSHKQTSIYFSLEKIVTVCYWSHGTLIGDDLLKMVIFPSVFCMFTRGCEDLPLPCWENRSVFLILTGWGPPVMFVGL